jgi:hypothetical protein
MLAALYSRSPASVMEHLERVKAAGSGKFMSQYYVRYGHKSIADCGSTSIFVEGISILAAKAIQDHPLYSGQESSTRYIDFSKQPIQDPLGTADSWDIQQRWMKFYFKSQPELTEDYERAVKARVFDILRAFLPAGATTNVAWHTNLRQARDKLATLVVHPDPRISRMAEGIASELHHKYPSSGFGNVGGSADARTYRSKVMAQHAYAESAWGSMNIADVWFNACIDDIALEDNVDLLWNRPAGVELPRFLSNLGVIHSRFLLDFGSYRDLQRHRNGTIRMPLLTGINNFCLWYFEQMPAKMAHEAIDLVRDQTERIEALPTDKITKQYYYSLGFNVVCEVTQDLPAFVYRLELRSAKTVHPTLRDRVLEEIKHFRRRFPDIKLHVDTSPDDWDVRRGTQTIELRDPG